MNNNLRILHVSGGGINDGAARGAYWLHKGLESLGVSSKFLVQWSVGGADNVISASDRLGMHLLSLCQCIRNRMPIWRYWQCRDLYNTGFHGLNLTTWTEYEQADIIHFHWIPSGIVGLDSFPGIEKPIVWTLRDMWPFTGGCHYSMDCRKYYDKCGACPVLKSDGEDDLSRRVFKKKEKVYGSNIQPVAISCWLRDEAQKSTLFHDAKVKFVPNGLDINDFKPLEKSEARKHLNLPIDEKIILVGAKNLTNKYKGFQYAVEIIDALTKQGYRFLFFGKMDSSLIEDYADCCHILGHLETNEALCKAYSAADVFLATSLQEAFGKTLIEAMACGTPVVAFDATGPKDIVDHLQTGYLAEPYQVKDLLYGIHWVLGSDERRKSLSLRSRSVVEERYAIDKIAKQYVQIYSDILS